MLWDVMRLLWGCYLSFLLIGCGSNVGLKSSRWVVMVQQTGWHSTLQCVKFIYPVEGRRGRRWRRCIEDSRANWNWIAYEVNPNSKMLKGVKVIWRGSGGVLRHYADNISRRLSTFFSFYRFEVLLVVVFVVVAVVITRAVPCRSRSVACRNLW